MNQMCHFPKNLGRLSPTLSIYLLCVYIMRLREVKRIVRVTQLRSDGTSVKSWALLQYEGLLSHYRRSQLRNYQVKFFPPYFLYNSASVPWEEGF